jgi:hypothetical protein
MRRRTGTVIVILAILVALSTSRRAAAVVVATPTGAVKAAQSDLIVTGKVASQAVPSMEATPTPQAKDKITFTMYKVVTTEVLKGEAKDKDILVGVPTGKAGATPAIKLTAGQEGLFYLKKHHEGNFFVPALVGAFVSAQNKVAYGKELDEVRQTLKILADPLAGLKSGDAAKRQETIAVLMNVYRTAPPSAAYKLEPIPVEESRLILKGLLDADWDYNKYKGANYNLFPGKLFNFLQLTPKDGFQDPKQGILSPEYAAAAKKWLEKNWQDYRLQKVVLTATQ